MDRGNPDSTQNPSELSRRYRSGEHREVWNELMDLGELSQGSPDFSTALTVVHDLMTRVKHNIGLLVPRLRDLGYEFEFPELVLVEPGADAAELVSTLEATVGPIPVSLRGWYEVVGSVCLMGSHSDWKGYFEGDFVHDPLVVDPIHYVFEEHANWTSVRDTIGEENVEQFEIPISPDLYHKSNISGGSAYSIRVPDHHVDAPLRHEWHNTTFVNYLRIAFKWGGFAGFERCPKVPEELKGYLARNLLDF